MEQSSSIPTTLYEFPNGYNINLTIDKFKLTEGLFNASNLSGISGGDLLGIPNIVMNSASMCDVDIRPVRDDYHTVLRSQHKVSYRLIIASARQIYP